MASTHSRVTERPNHGNRPALLALRKLDVSNEANLGTPATLAIRVVHRCPRCGRWPPLPPQPSEITTLHTASASSPNPMSAAQPMMMSARRLCWAYS
ncbi:MAG: hypothetical protein QOE32_5648 [Pseudonocardiales bacterium]|nr:hypothetical protein [Pseudonocardiales bacterium]